MSDSELDSIIELADIALEMHDDGKHYFKDAFDRTDQNKESPWGVFRIEYDFGNVAGHCVPNEVGHHDGMRTTPEGQPESTCGCNPRIEILECGGVMVIHEWMLH